MFCMCECRELSEGEIEVHLLIAIACVVRFFSDFHALESHAGVSLIPLKVRLLKQSATDRRGSRAGTCRFTWLTRSWSRDLPALRSLTVRGVQKTKKFDS